MEDLRQKKTAPQKPKKPAGNYDSARDIMPTGVRIEASKMHKDRFAK